MNCRPDGERKWLNNYYRKFNNMEPQFTPEQSLQLIQTMIVKTRAKLSENRFYFLLWGWLTFTALLLQFTLKVFMHYQHHYLVWLLTFPAVIITLVHAGKRQKVSGARTYVGESMSNLWMGIGISFFVLSFIISNQDGTGWLRAFPFFILFYGLGTFVSGRILRFAPFVIGGIFNWAIALVAVFLPYDQQILLAALAILTSYIIPAHLITTKEK